MANPLSLLPYAIAAADGRVKGMPVAALIAAGFALLQRSVPLVRALASRSPAILLPHGSAFVAALAACDGHAALVLDPARDASTIRAALDRASVSVVFTDAQFAARVPSDRLIVLLDDAPREAQVQVPGAAMRRVDLGSHVGLAVEGERGAGGSEAAVLRWVDDEIMRSLSHRDVMAAGNNNERVPGLVNSLLRPLLRGESC